MEQAATNLTEIAADSVSIWDASSKRWTEVRDVFVTKGQITSPVTVSIPVADEGRDIPRLPERDVEPGARP